VVKITFLGTGGAVGTAARDNTSLLLEIGSELLLIDCPGSLTQKILRAGYRPERVSAIFITHIHPDHIYGLPSLVHSLMLENKQVKLFGSAETIDFSRRLLDLFELQKEKILYRLDFRPLLPGRAEEIAPQIEVTGWPVSHHSSSLAFIFDTVEGRIGYSGDTAICNSLFTSMENGECLIHDCSAPSRYFKLLPFLQKMHTDSLELGKKAEIARVKNLIPIHFFSDLDFSSEEIEIEIKKSFSGELIVPDDGQSISLFFRKGAERL
jgi:Metal-dependent hydrolases of the beta-lactamase superfamily III